MIGKFEIEILNLKNQNKTYRLKRDNSGTISVKEIRSVFSALNINFNEQQTSAFVKEIDINSILIYLKFTLRKKLMIDF